MNRRHEDDINQSYAILYKLLKNDVVYFAYEHNIKAYEKAYLDIIGIPIKCMPIADYTYVIKLKVRK